MQRLNEMADQVHLYAGTIIRVYNVQRFDVIKTKTDHSDDVKKNIDYYDLMLVDVNVVAKGVFILVNITWNNDNKGSVFCVFENIDSKGGMQAEVIKRYFGNELDAFIIV